jgi:molybdate-binding protein
VKFKAVKGDKVDEAIGLALASHDLDIPFIRIGSNNLYLIGTEKKSAVVKGDKCMVRVGGGYESLMDYLKAHQETE